MCYYSRFGQPCTWSARDTLSTSLIDALFNAPFNATIIFESRRPTQNWDGEFFFLFFPPFRPTISTFQLSNCCLLELITGKKEGETKKRCLRLFKIVDKTKTDRIFMADTTHVGEGIPWESGGARWFHCVNGRDLFAIHFVDTFFFWRWGDAPTIHHSAMVLSLSLCRLRFIATPWIYIRKPL